jgi:hypothetical protein
MKLIQTQKLVRESTYYDMVLWRLCDEMSDDFYECHRDKLDKLVFLINSHKQNSEIEKW